MTRQRILVTGAAGHLGRAVLAELIRAPDRPEIIGFDRNTRAARRVLGRFGTRVRAVHGDVADAARLAAAVAGVSTVLHLAALIPPAADRDPALTRRVNLGGTEALIGALRANAPGAFVVFASSVAVYGDRLTRPDIRVGDRLAAPPGEAYAQSKIAAEAALARSGLDGSVFRLAALLDGQALSPLLFHMPLDTLMETVSSRDAARAFARARLHRAALSGQIFNLGGGPDCRIRYRDFLAENFSRVGLGALDFPEEAFARCNFHCGAYADGALLDDILGFRRDTLASHFARLDAAWPWWKRAPVALARRPIKRWLLGRSEPLKALRQGDAAAQARFFGRVSSGPGAPSRAG